MSVVYLDQPFEVKDSPLWFHLRGLSETRSGYGRKLHSTRMIRIKGETRWRRVYVILYSNSGTSYVLIKGRMRIIRDSDFPVDK